MQFPYVLQTLRAPQLRCVSLEGSPGAVQKAMAERYAKENRPMPVNAGNLAWLLHHPHLEKVSITATEVGAAAWPLSLSSLAADIRSMTECETYI